MRIGITGVTGLIGQRIAALAASRGHRVVGFSRSAHAGLPDCEIVRPFSTSQAVDLDGLDGVIHLAGESVLGFWTTAKKERVLASRRDTTRALVSTIAGMTKKPAVLLCASGTGFYGNRGAEILDESASAGGGFLGQVAQIWEQEAFAAETSGVRVCALRTGLVLARRGGAFPLLRGVFGFGLGGKLGGGQQYLPWLHLDDIAALYLFCLEHESISGPVNAAAPEACTNAVFTLTLAGVLHRPAIFGVPAWAMQFALGEQARLVLDSQRVAPAQALAHGYPFRHPQLRAALRHLTA